MPPFRKPVAKGRIVGDPIYARRQRLRIGGFKKQGVHLVVNRRAKAWNARHDYRHAEPLRLEMSKPVRLPMGRHDKAVQSSVEPCHSIDVTKHPPAVFETKMANVPFNVVTVFPITGK